MPDNLATDPRRTRSLDTDELKSAAVGEHCQILANQARQVITTSRNWPDLIHPMRAARSILANLCRPCGDHVMVASRRSAAEVANLTRCALAACGTESPGRTRSHNVSTPDSKSVIETRCLLVQQDLQPTPTAWDIGKTTGRNGTGHWRFWDRPVDDLRYAAARWAQAVQGIERPWLCWNMNDQWCLLQQRLVTEVGWTPVVGWDPNCGKAPSRLVPGAVAIDFNADLKLQVLYQHVPLELVFLWADRLAFWHADVLMSRKKMAAAARRFEKLADGEMAAVLTYGGMRNIIRPKFHRFWEVLGCTTSGASRDQFDKGCGWWRGFQYHPSGPSDPLEVARRNRYYDDHGCGVRYWQRFCGGRVDAISERWITKEHFSVITVRNYKRAGSKSEEMDINFDLGAITKRLQISDLLSH